MRIFYAADTTPNAAFHSNLWRWNLCTPLMDMGHEVVEFDFDLRPVFLNLDPGVPEQARFIEKQRPRTSRELLRQITREHARKPLDLFFSYFYDACVLPETIDAIRSLGIRTMNFYCNASYQLHLVAEIAPRYDWCLVPEKFRLQDYVALGARPIYCQMAANPALYRPVPDATLDYDMTFVGQAYGERPATVAYLRSHGLDVRVWGDGWSRHSDVPREPWRRRSLGSYMRAGRRLAVTEGWRAVGRRLRSLAVGRQSGSADADVDATLVRLPASTIGPTLTDAEMISMYSRSRINLGFSSVGDPRTLNARILQVRLRDFEVPMSGGFYMVEYMKELEEFYEIGREIVCYRDPADLAEKAAYYLAHSAEREAIRRAGHERAKRDHTWQRRFESVFRVIENGAAPAV